MNPRTWLLYLAGSMILAVGYFLVGNPWLRLGIILASGLSGVACVIIGVLVHKPRYAVAWWTLAVGLLFEICGDLSFGWYSLYLHDTISFPTFTDALYLSGEPLIAASMVLLIRARRSGMDRSSVIDAAIVATGVGLLSWVFLMAPTASSSELDRPGRIVALAYPIWDVLFLALLVRLLSGSGVRIPALRLLFAAVGVWLITDMSYTVLLQYSAYDLNWLLSGVWMFAYMLYGAAAMHPSVTEATLATIEPLRRFTRWRLGLLTGASLIAPILLLGQVLLNHGTQDGLAIGIASAVLFLLVVARMASLVRQVEEQSAQLAVLAQRDGLTGVPNRRTWDSELPQAMDRARRDGRPLSVALLDLDRFKAFNDEYGHQAGDRLLKSASAAWSAGLRSVDMLCRYGGEEFGVILPGVGAGEAAMIVDRLRAATPLDQSFSAGLACWDREEASDELVGRTDRALYSAKEAGRDRVVISDERVGQLG